MAETTTTDTTTLVDTHLVAYAEPDATRRTELLARVWAADGQLLDPPFDGAGIEAISALTDTVVEHFPGHTFRRTTAVDEHHGFARYGWELVAADGTVAVAGIDVAEVRDGQLVRIVGFFGDLAAA